MKEPLQYVLGLDIGIESVGWAVIRCGQTDLAMKSGGGDGEDLLTALLMELAVKKGA